MSTLVVTGYHYFQAPSEASFVFCFVLSLLYFCCDDQSSHARSEMKEAAPNCHRLELTRADSLELSLIKSEISQSEECLRSWELRPADNLPGI